METLTVNVDRALSVEDVHRGNDHTSRSGAWNQVPRNKLKFYLRGLSVEYSDTDLKPLNYNLQCIRNRFCGLGIITYKVF